MKKVDPFPAKLSFLNSHPPKVVFPGHTNSSGLFIHYVYTVFYLGFKRGMAPPMALPK